MKKPVLVVMAAGMGSRYGGLKQIDPIDKDGDIIIDFSIFFVYCFFISAKSQYETSSYTLFCHSISSFSVFGELCVYRYYGASSADSY